MATTATTAATEQTVNDAPVGNGVIHAAGTVLIVLVSIVITVTMVTMVLLMVIVVDMKVGLDRTVPLICRTIIG